MARPTKYNAAMQAKADEYIFGESWREIDNIPSVEGLAKFLGVARATLYTWGDLYVGFLDTLGEIESEQKRVTLNGGISNEFNATIAKLVLANHGMHDKQDTNHVMNISLESDSVDL